MAPSASQVPHLRVLPGSEGQTTRCPYCHADLAPNQEQISCSACRAPHHVSCWQEHGRCASCDREEGAPEELAPAEPGRALPSLDETLAEFPSMREASENFAHWEHAKVVLATEYPTADPEHLRQAYRLALELQSEGEGDPRVEMAFDRHLQVVRGTSGWLHSTSLTAMKHLCASGLVSLPWSLHRAQGGRWKPHGMKVSLAGSTEPLLGYTPIRPIRGLATREVSDGQEIVVAVQPTAGEHVRSLQADELLPEQEAFIQLARFFPGISWNYMMALLAATICAEEPSLPIMIFGSGPTGSGKGETVRVAASFFGDILPKINVSAEHSRFLMQIGSALAEGRRFLLLDEVGKLRNREQLLRRLLEISTEVTWRPLYVTGSTTTANRGVIVLSHISIPTEWCRSPEFRRRVRTIRLPRSTPNWEQACGGDSATWRSRSPAHARIANSLVTHAARLAQEHAFQWQAIADRLGLDTLDAPEVDQRALIDLYRHCRNDNRRRTLFSRGYFGRGAGWVDLRLPRDPQLMELLLPEDSQAEWQALKHRLEGTDWNGLLGIRAPDVKCEVRFHGRQRAVRYVQCNCPRGRELRNEALPPPVS